MRFQATYISWHRIPFTKPSGYNEFARASRRMYVCADYT